MIMYFKSLISSIIKTPVHKIDPDIPMEKYGINSIIIVTLNGELEKVFGSLSKTLFFEYKNLRELTGYFLETYRDKLIHLLGLNEDQNISGQASVPDTNPVDSGIDHYPAKIKKSNFRLRGSKPGQTPFHESKEKEILDIAIIGLSGRYPGAGNIREFWKNLRDGKDCITQIPPDRWNHSLYFDEDRNKAGKTYSKWGGFLENVDSFDPLFFNISPREAEIMDPQERLFLECVYETFEDAGYSPGSLKQCHDNNGNNKVGIFVGVMYEEYQLYGIQEGFYGRPVALPGNPASIANRVSYFFNFHGPSMAVDTMCSSSLTTVHLACQSIIRGESTIAIAGGVNVSIHPNKYLFLGQSNFLSSMGRCKSFGQGGDGYVPGEGVGAVLLKPLDKAIQDKDHIYGIIKGTAVNHCGKTNGYTVPNPIAQAEVIRMAFKRAGIDAGMMSYLEAHGTGTSLGDPIEITGLVRAFREYTNNKQFCSIGSVKSNIGHCESAAGIAGITKVLLQLKHRTLVPSLHSRELNPNIDFSVTPFFVQKNLSEWKRPTIERNGETKEYPRIAGISSFGAGGSNAHVIIETDSAEESPSQTEQGTSLPVIESSLSTPGNTARFRHYTYSKTRKIAIISQACRLPLSPTPEEYWLNLAAGQDLITKIPENRWDVKQFYSKDRANPNTAYTDYGGFIKGIEYFDGAFFGVDDYDALTMDPQQRIILELTQELFNRAGYQRNEVNNSNTGVFIGAKGNNYLRNNYHLIPEHALQHVIVNSIGNMIPARVSDFYNLKGISETIDTACSSSLVAVHSACESILSGELDMAIAAA